MTSGNGPEKLRYFWTGRITPEISVAKYYNLIMFQMNGKCQRLIIIIVIIIIKDLQIHRPQLASMNHSYLQVNYMFFVLPSEIEPSLKDSLIILY